MLRLSWWADFDRWPDPRWQALIGIAAAVFLYAVIRVHRTLYPRQFVARPAAPADS
jgi:hypothetical protein